MSIAKLCGHRRVLRGRAAFCTLIALGLALSTAGSFAREVSFCSDAAHPFAFGLFIGIDGYPQLDERSRLHSCVHDATAMENFFRSRFYVTQSVLLTEQAATRNGIGNALRELVRRVTEARAKLDGLPLADRQPIHVVITYSGHGVRVKRLKSEAGSDPDDDAWLCDDSTMECDQVIRGFELLEIHQQLARLGASVLIVSDSCHSGSNYRGIDQSLAQARTIPIDGSKDGPQENLFAEFSTDLPSGQDASDDRSKPLPGFVFFSACSDGERAYDLTCGDHREGRLTHVILSVLESNHGNTTYRDMAAQITARFAADFEDQNPEFHGAPGKADELFLGKGLPSPEAHVLSTDPNQNTVVLDLGNLGGIDKETAFTFYRNVDDLQQHQNPVATGTVLDVQAMNCTVLVDHPKAVDATTVAKYDRPRMTHVIVGIDGQVPPEIKDQLQELAKYKQIQLATQTLAPTLMIHYFPATQTIGFYSPTALPATRPSEPDPAPLRRIGYTGPQDADRFSQNLLYEAGVQRLMSLRRDGGEALFSAAVQSDSAANVDQASPPDGLKHIAEHARFYVTLHNTSRIPLYFTVIGVTRNGDLKILYPSRAQDGDGLIQPGVSVDVDKGVLKATVTPGTPKGSAEMTHIKIIASDHREPLASLAVPPDAGLRDASRGIRGETDPLFELVRDAIHGGARGFAEGNSGDIEWQSANLDFDVIKQ